MNYNRSNVFSYDKLMKVKVTFKIKITNVFYEFNIMFYNTLYYP